MNRNSILPLTFLAICLAVTLPAIAQEKQGVYENPG
jgi:hypothetical protein